MACCRCFPSLDAMEYQIKVLTEFNRVVMRKLTKKKRKELQVEMKGKREVTEEKKARLLISSSLKTETVQYFE